MEKCQKYETLFEKYISGDLDDSGYKKLLDHTEECPACHSLMELHDRLSGQPWPEEIPTENEFLNMRKRVLNQIEHTKPARSKFRLKQLLPKPVLALAWSAAMLFVGFISAYNLIPETTNNGNSLLRQINYVAEANDGFSDVQNSPYIFTNVRIKSQSGDRINLSFDVSSHLEIERPKNDPLVREVLAQSLLNPSSVGTRLKAISFVRDQINPKTRDAMLFSLKNDENIAVRLKAMTALASQPKSEVITNAFIEILKKEESVQMRLIAIEYLANTGLNHEQLQQTLEESDKKTDTAIKIKAQDYLKNNN